MGCCGLDWIGLVRCGCIWWMDRPRVHTPNICPIQPPHHHAARAVHPLQFQDSRKYYLVLEICVGGELFDRIVEKVSKGCASCLCLSDCLFLSLSLCPFGVHACVCLSDQLLPPLPPSARPSVWSDRPGGRGPL